MESQQKWEQFECLHPHVVKALYQQGFLNPTSIQSEVYENYKHYFDFLIASQTGSGKTLSFTAPIVSDLLQLSQNCELPHRPLCLILTPTRELALQISQTLTPLLTNTQITSICILGGLSQAKQVRILKQKHPHIIIGTPGRIHELLEEEEINLEMLKFLVLDEADRMVEMGHYVELDGILKRVFRGKVEEFFEKGLDEINKRLDEMEKEQQNEFYIIQNGKKKKLNLNLNSFQTEKLFEVPMELFQVPGITSETTQQTENQEIKKEKQKQKQKKVEKKKLTEKKEMEEEQEEEEENNIEEENMEIQGEDNGEGDVSQLEVELTQEQKEILNKMKRKVFFISATLTREFKGTKYFTKKKIEDEKTPKSKSKSKSKQINKKSEKSSEKSSPENQLIPKLSALLSRIQSSSSSSKPKIIDQSSLIFLPEKLSQFYTFCDSDLDKFTTILSYINELSLEMSKIIIFTNTIRAAKRVKFFLNSAGLKTVSLHSHMMQKQRLEKLEKFEKSKESNILICTDVAARGLDFVITHVIQFSVPVNGDTYVHRVGRTARANRPGQALVLISEKEVSRWEEICETLKTASSLPKKYNPIQSTYDTLHKKVEEYEWIRLNSEKSENKRIEKLNEEEAEEFGVEALEEEEKKKKPKRITDFEEEENIRRCEINKRIKEINWKNKIEEGKGNGKGVEVGDGKVWKKNKLVMTLDEIKKYL